MKEGSSRVIARMSGVSKGLEDGGGREKANRSLLRSHFRSKFER